MDRESEYLIFKGLSDPHRIRILEILKDKEVCTCKLSCELGMPLSTLAHHMKVLVASGVINSRRCGKWTYYSLNKEQIQFMKGIVDRFLD